MCVSGGCCAARTKRQTAPQWRIQMRDKILSKKWEWRRYKLRHLNSAWQMAVTSDMCWHLEGKQRPCRWRPSCGGIAYTSFEQDRQCSKSEARSRDYFCNGKAICVTYSECVSVALGTQHAMHVRHILIFALPRSTKYFPTLSHKRYDFREKVTEHKICVSILFTNMSETFLILWRTEQDMIKNLYRSSCKVPVIFVRF